MLREEEGIKKEMIEDANLRVVSFFDYYMHFIVVYI